MLSYCCKLLLVRNLRTSARFAATMANHTDLDGDFIKDVQQGAVIVGVPVIAMMIG